MSSCPLSILLYGESSTLFYDGFCTLLSEEGSQQGCPLGGLLFVMSIASIAEGVAQRYPNVTILGYADDYRFIGPWRDAMDARIPVCTIPDR